MNLLLFIPFLLFQNPTTPPLGKWLHKEDSSKIEIFIKEQKLYGRLTSTKNQEHEPGMLVLRNFEFIDGHWKGEFYNVKNKRWVEADFLISEDLIVVHYKYGFIKNKYYLSKEN